MWQISTMKWKQSYIPSDRSTIIEKWNPHNSLLQTKKRRSATQNSSNTFFLFFSANMNLLKNPLKKHIKIHWKSRTYQGNENEISFEDHKHKVPRLNLFGETGYWCCHYIKNIANLHNSRAYQSSKYWLNCLHEAVKSSVACQWRNSAGIIIYGPPNITSVYWAIQPPV